MEDLLLGIISIILGLIFISYTKRNPVVGNDYLLLKLRGYVGGILCIIVGLWILITLLMKLFK